jgi:hypothetical protein
MFSIGDPGGITAPAFRNSTEILRGIRGGVDLDGGTAHFDVAFTNQNAFRGQIPFEVMPLVLAEIRAASALMLRRQQLRLDHGHDTMLALMDTALRPAQVEAIVDPLTHDRIIIHQFYDHAPILFRLSPLELQMNMATIHAAMRRMLH